MDLGVWQDEDFQVRIKVENPKIELTKATQKVSETI
jgi:hypothetical protein